MAFWLCYHNPMDESNENALNGTMRSCGRLPRSSSHYGPLPPTGPNDA
jgi:hypothetical protein